MQIEEVKVEQKDLCANCSFEMKVISSFDMPIELNCNHEVCLKCVLVALP